MNLSGETTKRDIEYCLNENSYKKMTNLKGWVKVKG